jgi:hypothetical protein
MTYYYVIVKYNVYLRHTKSQNHEKDSKHYDSVAVCDRNEQR